MMKKIIKIFALKPVKVPVFLFNGQPTVEEIVTLDSFHWMYLPILNQQFGLWLCLSSENAKKSAKVLGIPLVENEGVPESWFASFVHEEVVL